MPLTLRQRRLLDHMRREQERKQREVDRRDAELATQWPNYSQTNYSPAPGTEGDPQSGKVAGAGGRGVVDFHVGPSSQNHTNFPPTSNENGSHLSDSSGSSSGSCDSGSGGGE